MKLVEESQFNKAFEEALTAANLSLVMFLCKQLDTQVVFQNPGCQLSQPIILSLIQQLSVSLEEDTETKQK